MGHTSFAPAQLPLVKALLMGLFPAGQGYLCLAPATWSLWTFPGGCKLLSLNQNAPQRAQGQHTLLNFSESAAVLCAGRKGDFFGSAVGLGKLSSWELSCPGSEQSPADEAALTAGASRTGHTVNLGSLT